MFNQILLLLLKALTLIAFKIAEFTIDLWVALCVLGMMGLLFSLIPFS